MFLAEPIIEQNGNKARGGAGSPDGFAPFSPLDRKKDGAAHGRARIIADGITSRAVVAGAASRATHGEAQHASPQTFYATAIGFNAAVIPGRVVPH
jgi:hypothetical protein